MLRSDMQTLPRVQSAKAQNRCGIVLVRFTPRSHGEYDFMDAPLVQLTIACRILAITRNPLGPSRWSGAVRCTCALPAAR